MGKVWVYFIIGSNGCKIFPQGRLFWKCSGPEINSNCKLSARIAAANPLAREASNLAEGDDELGATGGEDVDALVAHHGGTGTPQGPPDGASDEELRDELEKAIKQSSLSRRHVDNAKMMDVSPMSSLVEELFQTMPPSAELEVVTAVKNYVSGLADASGTPEALVSKASFGMTPFVTHSVDLVLAEYCRRQYEIALDFEEVAGGDEDEDLVYLMQHTETTDMVFASKGDFVSNVALNVKFSKTTEVVVPYFERLCCTLGATARTATTLAQRKMLHAPGSPETTTTVQSVRFFARCRAEA